MMPTIDESQKYYIEQKKPETKKPTFYDSILISSRSNKKSMRMKIRIMVASGGEEC